MRSSAAPCVDAVSFTGGRPFGSMRRRMTVSPDALPSVLTGGSTWMPARTRPRSSTISSARPRSTGAVSAAAVRSCASRNTRSARFTTVSAASRRCIFMLSPSGAYTGRLEPHAARPPHEVELEVDELVRPQLGDLRAYAEDAVAQPPPERPQVLPLEAVDRVAGRVR